MSLFDDAPELDPDDIIECILCGLLFFDEDGPDVCAQCRRWMEAEEGDLFSAEDEVAHERMRGG